jgi:rod shape determining protein RodA
MSSTFNSLDSSRGQRTLSITARVLSALNLDGTLVTGLIIVGAIGIGVLFSSSGANIPVLEAQGMRFIGAIVIMIVLAQIPPRVIRRAAPWLYLFGLGLLIAVMLTGDISMGAQRWLDLGIVRFQPSEIMKVAVPLMCAWFLHDRPLPPSFLSLVGLAIIIGVPTGIIAEQPDLGTALLVAAAGIIVIIMSGLQMRYIVGLGVLAGAAGPIAWHFLHDYQRQRVLTFLNPQEDPLGTGYHIIQSQIAIGSGGVFGKGFMNGSQAQLEFLPERSTDFVFAVIGEEWGFIGVVTLLLLYAFVISRSLYLAATAQDTFSRLAAGALSLTFSVYVLVNTGMVTGLLPVVGVPLPLVSYGGTSMVTLLAGFGILMSLCARRKLVGR